MAKTKREGHVSGESRRRDRPVKFVAEGELEVVIIGIGIIVRTKKNRIEGTTQRGIPVEENATFAQ